MRSIVVGTAGHIDHGKSALVYALTGTDPDRLKEEKARGITIDLGFAHAVIDGTNFAFVDVPGHERFVKNMLAGVGGIDLLVLVVAADESVMPQTREHFDICRLLRIPAGVIVLTKTDLADARMRWRLARLEVRELVAGSMLESRRSSGLGAGRSRAWTTFAHAAGRGQRARARPRPADALTRLPIDRVFSMKGFGTVVTGTLVSGRIAVDDQLADRAGRPRASRFGRAGARAASHRCPRGRTMRRQRHRRRRRGRRARAGAGLRPGPSSRHASPTSRSKRCPGRGRCATARACASTRGPPKRSRGSASSAPIRRSRPAARGFLRLRLESPMVLRERRSVASCGPTLLRRPLPAAPCSIRFRRAIASGWPPPRRAPTRLPSRPVVKRKASCRRRR